MTAETPIHTQGEQLGSYQLERLLGRGAAAEVWQAIETGDLGFRKRQALKLLRPPPGEMEAQKKALITEARVCGHLKHPGVVDVYRVGDHAGEIYVAMEFVDGPDLNTLIEGLRRQKVEIPVSVCIEMAIEICDALDHAHTACDDTGASLEIIHRDLKPSNILVDRRGVLKITDWGLVKSSLNLESTTRGVVKGTPGYIAPEVWGGTRDFQPSVDLFAVGAMLYEFVVGARLFQGGNLARIAEQVARRKPEEEAAQVGRRAPVLEVVVSKLLQRVPANRYQTAEEAADTLRSAYNEVEPKTTIKNFLRDVSHIVEELSPMVTGVGRAGVDPAMAVDEPTLGSAPSGPTVDDSERSTNDDEEHPTDPNMPPNAAVSPSGPVFEAPWTVSLPVNGPGGLGSAFGPDGPLGTEGQASDVPATRAMLQIDMSEPPTESLGEAPADVGATRVQPRMPEIPEEAKATIPPEGGRRAISTGPIAPKKRRKKRPVRARAGAPRKRRKRTSPAAKPPQKRGTSLFAMLAVIGGVTLLVIGIWLALNR